jgi:hypothetical protein
MNFDRTLNLCNRVILISLFLFSCKKADLSTTASNDAANDNTAAPRTVLQETTTPQNREMNCSVDCINPQGPFVEASSMVITSWGGPNSDKHTKTVSYVAYNTATEFVVKVTYTKSGLNTNASDSVKVTACGTMKYVPTLASGATATFTFPLPLGWKSCDAVDFYIHQQGQNEPITMGRRYQLFGVCQNRCTTLFSGNVVTCGEQREAEYRFIAAEDMDYIKIQGGLTNFTGENADVSITGGNLTWSQSTPGGSSNRVIKIEGSVSACQEVVIHVKWNSSNSGGTITGQWSVKDANGVEVASTVASLQCQ